MAWQWTGDIPLSESTRSGWLQSNLGYPCLVKNIHKYFFFIPLCTAFILKNSNESEPPIPATQVCKKLTWKIQGQSQGWDEMSRSYSESNILLIHIPFVPCQSGDRFTKKVSSLWKCASFSNFITFCKLGPFLVSVSLTGLTFSL